MVGPIIGRDLQLKGIYATLASIVGITIYIGLRFRFAFAIGAIAATLHDVLVTLAFLTFFHYDLSLNIVAAILTITGYSVNDTIVIFDRVRENLRGMRRDSLEHVVNTSVNQTLGRTIITAGTTFLAVLALYLFGGEVLRRLCVHDAGRHHQRHVFDGVHCRGHCHHPERQAGQGARGGGREAGGRRAQGLVGRTRQRLLVDLLAAVVLGIVQGLTEFLPVSSSGHLILARAFFGWDAGRFGLAFDVACHVGTLLAVVVYFRRDVAAMIAAAPAALMRARRTGGAAGAAGRRRDAADRDRGAGASATRIDTVRSPAVVAVTLALGGAGLLWAERAGSQNRDEASDRLREAFAIGCAQAAALVPGISRSGATLTLAMLVGLAPRVGGAVRVPDEPARGAGGGGEGDLRFVGGWRRRVAGDVVCGRPGGVGGRGVPDDQVLPAVSGQSFPGRVCLLPVRARGGDGGLAL